MKIVVDTSAVVAALTDDSEIGHQVKRVMRENNLLAPAPLDLEVISALRGMAHRDEIDEIVAEEAVTDVSRMRIRRIPTAQLHDRIWGLRHNLTAYDAAFVALAESLGAPLLTLDMRLTRAQGPACEFITPDTAG